MDRRDDELLARQLRGVAPPRNDGLVGLTVVTVFFAGLSLGAYVFAPHQDAPVPHDAVAVMSVPGDSPATVQR